MEMLVNCLCVFVECMFSNNADCVFDRNPKKFETFSFNFQEMLKKRLCTNVRKITEAVRLATWFAHLTSCPNFFSLFREVILVGSQFPETIGKYLKLSRKKYSLKCSTGHVWRSFDKPAERFSLDPKQFSHNVGVKNSELFTEKFLPSSCSSGAMENIFDNPARRVFPRVQKSSARI